MIGNIVGLLKELFADMRGSKEKQLLSAVGFISVVLLAAGPYIGFRRSFLFYLMFWISMALSLNIIFGLTGYVPFGYFAFYGVGVYTALILVTHLSLPMGVVILFGGGAGVLLGILFIPMLRLEGIYFAIANFAAGYAILIGVPHTPREITGGATGLQIAGAYDPIASYYAMFLLLLIILVSSILLNRSRLGTMLKAIRDNPQAAEMSGLNRGRIRAYAWLLSALFPALLGAVDAWNSIAFDPETAFDLTISIQAFLYVIFGGAGTLLGPILGAGSLFVIDDAVSRHAPFEFSFLLMGFILMFVVIALPRGIVGEYRYREEQIRETMKERLNRNSGENQ